MLNIVFVHGQNRIQPENINQYLKYNDLMKVLKIKKDEHGFYFSYKSVKPITAKILSQSLPPPDWVINELEKLKNKNVFLYITKKLETSNSKDIDFELAFDDDSISFK
jgi:hypothetical protein